MSIYILICLRGKWDGGWFYEEVVRGTGGDNEPIFLGRFL